MNSWLFVNGDCNLSLLSSSKAVTFRWFLSDVHTQLLLSTSDIQTVSYTGCLPISQMSCGVPHSCNIMLFHDDVIHPCLVFSFCRNRFALSKGLLWICDTGVWHFVTKTFLTLVEDWRKYWHDSGWSLDLIPNHCQLTADASTCWTTGRTYPEPVRYILSIPAANAPKRKPTVSSSVASWFPAFMFLASFMASLHFGLLFCGRTELQWAVRWARNNCRPESRSIGIAVTAMKPQLTSEDKCDCLCFLCLILPMEQCTEQWMSPGLQGWDQLRKGWTSYRRTQAHNSVAGSDNKGVDGLLCDLN